MEISQFINAFKEFYNLNKDLVKNKYKGFKRELSGEELFKKELNYDNIDDFYKNYNPVFVVTTGRTGSKFITSVLNHLPDINAYHEPSPDLKLMPDFAYNNYDDVALKKIIIAGKSELILKSYLKDNIYVESNQCLSFFVYALNDLFPNSKFIHLVRKPESFVLSAYKLSWYERENLWDYGRLKADFYKEDDSIENLYNLWNYTTEFIINFSEEIDESRFLTITSEDLFDDPQTIFDILKFIGMKKNNITADKILEIQNNPVNNKSKIKRKITEEKKKEILGLKNKYIKWDIYDEIYSGKANEN